MKTKVIKIGNSRGIRLPKVILQQVGINDEVNLEVDRDRIILKPIRHRRNGWQEAFLKWLQILMINYWMGKIQFLKVRGMMMNGYGKVNETF